LRSQISENFNHNNKFNLTTSTFSNCNKLEVIKNNLRSRSPNPNADITI